MLKTFTLVAYLLTAGGHVEKTATVETSLTYEACYALALIVTEAKPAAYKAVEATGKSVELACVEERGV